MFTQGERSADRSQGGLGLGLALVKNLVKLHGGTVNAASSGPGKGSAFSVRLPRLSDTPDQTDNHSDQSGLTGTAASRRILVVDDNVDAAETLSLLLETLRHTVSIEHGSLQALARVRRETPEIAFLDIGLPDINGYELAAQLRAMPEMRNAKLIAVSGYGQPEDRERAFQAGFDHHLVKPVSLDSIIGLIE